MQILLNPGEIAEAIMDMIAARVLMRESDVVHVTLTNDGATVHILPEGLAPVAADDNEEGDEPSGSEAQPAGESGRKRQRRSKAQIEADNKAERLALAEGKSQDTQTSTTSAETATATEPAQVEAAGDTSPSEVQEPGEPAVDPELAEHLATASAVEDAEADEALTAGTPVVEAEAEPVEATAEEGPSDVAPKASISLFANLRKPQNG